MHKKYIGIFLIICSLLTNNLIAMNKPKSFNNISEDVGLHVLKPFLSKDDLFKNRRVNKQFNKWFEDWVSKNTNDRIAKLINSIRKLKEKGANKDTDSLYLNGSDWVCDETLDILRKMCPKLRILEICDLKFDTYEKEQVDTKKILNFAKEHKCGVCYGRRGQGDTWFIAHKSGGHPQINYPPMQTEYGIIQMVPVFTDPTQ